MLALDAHDMKILTLLQRNARLTLGQLSERLHLSTSQCSRRIARLERDGIILGYDLRLAPRALSLDVTAFVFLSMDKTRMDDPLGAVAPLLAAEEVIDCHSVTGDHDFILKVMVASLACLSDFLSREVSSLPGLRDIATQVALGTLKSNGPLKILDR
ncbi:Lrp/AsnC family transcriptional regulator [Halomonas sp. V046]|uniref:Lrp/AsnC family transcriptional regulator n=1 Tax=Halomonas sp. V046 TaxID=3459611 RepID=UPI004044E46C